MSFIPKLSAPLTKAIRTLEGIVLTAAATTPWVVSLIDPHTLPSGVAAKWSVVSGIALAVSRTAIKIVGVVKGATGIEPQHIDTESFVQKVVERIHATVPTTTEIKKAIADGIAAIEHPEGIIGGLEKVAAGALSSSEEIAATPSSTGPVAPPANNALVGSGSPTPTAA